MDPSLWRVGARAVAFTALAVYSLLIPLVILVLVVVLVQVCFAWKVTPDLPDEFTKNFIVSFVILAILLALSGMQIWLSLMLLKATIKGVNPVFALRNTCIWLTVNTLVVLVWPVALTFVIVDVGIVFGVCSVCMLYVVAMYVRKLRRLIAHRGEMPPDFIEIPSYTPHVVTLVNS